MRRRGDPILEEHVQKAIGVLKELQKTTDIEAAHSQADEVLCILLDALDLHDVVAEWEKISKWYA
jgi:hypothetical protein